MSELTADNLYQRGAATLLAAWQEHARGTDGAAVRRYPGVAVAVFPRGPERGVYNNALPERDLGPARRRGLSSALTALLVHNALDRGCRTASLQSTPTAERIYANIGFRDLGRILEYG